MAKRPNVIFFCADQMRYDGVDCLGNPAIRTPNIGAIGRKGARFHKHRTPYQICSPSRATMFTGLYPRRHGLYKNGNALDPAHPVLADVLAAHGYRTHGVGKFHLQPLQAPVARRMPDSIAFGGTDEARDWWPAPNVCANPERMWSGGPRSTNSAARRYSTSSDRSRRATSIARHSRVYSSMMVSMRNALPSCVRAMTKS